MLVRALSLLRREDDLSDLELVFTGEERQSPDLARLVQSESLSRQVHFLGVISRQEIQAFYRHALLVPLPSLHEGYGLPLLEALRSECPVTCADIPAFRELLEDSNEGVLFFDPRDPISIAKAISLTIARRDELRQRQAKAYRRIAGRDWHDVAQDFLMIFEEACQLAKAQDQTFQTLGLSEEAVRHVA
jgi:glycosyltransferase involved in cell wall biosynthesis